MNGRISTKLIPHRILRYLKTRTKRTAPSTYEIAKNVKISWATVRIHLYKLKIAGVICGEERCAAVGESRKFVWWPS